MSATAGIAVLWFLCASLGATLVKRLFGEHRAAQAMSSAHVHWPLPMRVLLGSARVLAGLIDARLPDPFKAAVQRRLEKADLHPGVNASQWTALCLCVAITFWVATVAATSLLRLGGLLPATLALLAAWIGCERWLYRRIADCERQIVRELPACLDLLTLCVEAGATLTAAARFIVDQAPDGPLRNYFDRVLREVRSGRSRSQAFVSVADGYGVECLSTLASALSHAEAAGMSVGQVLRTQAEQRSAERFVRAERQAMQAPVKMLGPLIFCIFPCTFVVLAVPIAYRMMEAFQP